MATTNRGLAKVASASPDFESSGPWAGHNSAMDAIDQALWGVESHTSAGAISATEGKVFIGGSGVTALTLAAPTAGLPSAGGNDGQELLIIAVTAHAHTVTTPSNVINGNKHIATFASIGDSIRLVANNGVWIAAANSTTLS